MSQSDHAESFTLTGDISGGDRLTFSLLLREDGRRLGKSLADLSICSGEGCWDTHTHTHTHTYMPMCHITHTHFTPLIPAHVDTAHALFINSEAGKSQTAFWVTDLHIVGLQRRPAVGGLLQWDSELQKERNESVTDTVGVTECVQAELCTGNELTSLPSPSPFTPKQLNRGARTGPCQASPLPES